MHIRRFKFDKYGTSRRINTRVTFPLVGLDIEPYISEETRTFELSRDVAPADVGLYDLFAVSHHQRSNKFAAYSAKGGHCIRTAFLFLFY